MRKLTNKQRWVLGYVRENPGVTVNRIADNSPKKEWNWRGETQMIPSLNYGHAYNALQALCDRGFVRREAMVDSFGDELHAHLYFPTDVREPEPDDPLEKAFQLPSARVDN